MSADQAGTGVTEAGALGGGPLWLLAELTYACPLQCPYCSNPLDLHRYKDELDTATWKRVLREAREIGAVQLGFSGGEPLVRRDLEELIAEGRSLGFYTNLITSGVGMDEARVRAFKDAGLDHIQVSFQASSEELNDRMAGTAAFAHKLDMARAVKAAGFPMVMNLVLYRDNIDRVDEVIELALSLGADQLELANTQYYGWGYHNRERLLPTREQVRQGREVAERYQQQYADRCRIIFVVPDYYEERPKACMNGWGRTFLSIAPDGAALPCQAARMLPGINFPNVREHDIASIWRTSEAFERYRGEAWMKEPCRTCPERGDDFGGCRCQAYMLTGDATNADPVCSLSPYHEKFREEVDRIEAEALAAAASSDSSVDVSAPLVFRNPKNARSIARGEA